MTTFIVTQERGTVQELRGFSRNQVAAHVRKLRRCGLKVASVTQVSPVKAGAQ